MVVLVVEDAEQARVLVLVQLGVVVILFQEIELYNLDKNCSHF